MLNETGNVFQVMISTYGALLHAASHPPIHSHHTYGLTPGGEVCLWMACGFTCRSLSLQVKADQYHNSDGSLAWHSLVIVAIN